MDGIVIDVTSADLGRIEGFVLRTNDGRSLTFSVAALALDRGGKPAPHLREHMASGEPIEVDFRADGDRLLAVRYRDAPPAPVPSATPAPSPTPTEGAQPSQPAGSPSARPTDGAPPSPTAPGEPPPIGFAALADRFEGLTLLTHAADGSGQIYVVEQRGTVRVGTPDGHFADQPFLDISERVNAGGERGLLGLAFHPDFAQNRRFFVNYSAADGANVIAELRAGESAGAPADPGSERILLRIEQPFANHNGGMLAFGSDGYLYISSGDGGSAGDPLEAGQDLGSLLGKVLRIDVDGEQPYAIPADNPFVGQAGARPEIWSYGLRNPWRLSFDRQTGAMFIADVGQDGWEEVNAEPAGEGGRNYGWNVMEGPDCYRARDCATAGLVAPVAWYPTGEGCAITGGYVYRGQSLAALHGFYLYADYCTGSVWALHASEALDSADLPVGVHSLGSAGINVTAFGEDEAGELYLVGAGGEVLRVVAGD